MLYICIFIVLVVISIVLRIAAATGLVLPLAYGLIAPTLFSEWFHANQQLAEGIGWALVALVALMWVISLVQRVRAILDRRREEQIEAELVLYRLKYCIPDTH